MKLPCKVTNGDRTLRLRIERSQFLDFAFLKSHLSSLFPQPNSRSPIVTTVDDNMRYLDEDRQPIDILTAADLVECLQLFDDSGLSSIHLLLGSSSSSSGGSEVTLSSKTGGLDPYATSAETRHPLTHTLLAEISNAHSKVAHEVIEWWLLKMPEAYFREVDNHTRLSHLRALIALRLAGQKSEIALVSQDGCTHTIIKPRNYVGLLSHVIDGLPTDRVLREASIYTASGGGDALVIDVFEFAAAGGGDLRARKFQLRQHPRLFEDLCKCLTIGDTDDVEDRKALSMFLSCSEEHYVRHSQPFEIVRDFRLVQRAYLAENVAYLLEASSFNSSGDTASSAKGDLDSLFDMEQDSKIDELADSSRLTVVLPDFLMPFSFHRIAKHLSRLNVDILKAQLLQVENFKGRHFLILSFNIRAVDGVKIVPYTPFADRLCDEIKRLPHMDDEILSNVAAMNCSIVESELITAFCRVSHSLLAEEKPLVFTKYHIDLFLKDHLDIMRDLVMVFKMKFLSGSVGGASPSMRTIRERLLNVRQRIDKEVQMEDCKAFFNVSLAIVSHAIATNAQVANRYALVIQLEGAFFKEKDTLFENVSGRNVMDEEVPYMILFCLGRGFHGFHLAFRDVARGGLKVWECRGEEEYNVSNRNLFSECYNLAVAQHLKNKDLPEGGAKGILLLQPGKTSAEVAVKAFADGLLDIISASPTSSLKSVLYLGPDDKVTDEMIVWISERARIRGHPFPDSFMSGKPGPGINHVEYGVISEGIAVFLDVAIRNLGINPDKKSFTIKVCGGPCDPTASNLLLLLSRHFGQYAKIVAVADESGVAEDPAGLAHDELCRLVHSRLQIHEFSHLKLSSRGHVISASDGNISGVKARNSMLFRVESDVFIPADGSSNTINDYNWRQFMSLKGEGLQSPCSKVIIEGCNMFISPDARKNLADNNVLIVPDSSATKGGVICSSYEVLSGMLLPPAEFLKIKDKLIPEVMDRLRYFCRLEGELLFRELRASRAAKKNMRLSEISMQTSLKIIKLKDYLYQSDLLDVYCEPVSESPLSGPMEGRVHTPPLVPHMKKSFFIESPPPTSATEPVPSQSSRALAPIFTAYSEQHHKLCRDILVDYIPPSVKSVDNSRTITSSMQILHFDTIIPTAYKKRIVSTAIACKIVYKEGTDVLEQLMASFVDLNIDSQSNNSDDIKSSRISEKTLDYLLELDKRRNILNRIAQIDGLETEYKVQISQLLEMGGFFRGATLS